MSLNFFHPLWDSFQKDLKAAGDISSLIKVRDKYLSRTKGVLSLEMRQLGKLPPEQRPLEGQRLNQLKNAVSEALDQASEGLRKAESDFRLRRENLDVTLPGYESRYGAVHPIRRIWEEMEPIFVGMGFQVVEGTEVESDFYNFEALNIPENHPARNDQDTFFITPHTLLRTHTSPAQVRIMEQQEPPIRIVVPGRVYRRDAVDATHSPMFHQVEGLLVDREITMADLKGSLECFFRELFSSDTGVRLRPSYFPFVEPGAEVDISCPFCSGRGCRICKKSGWIEILGAGMVHPRVLTMGGIDPEVYTGYAWGMGIDRIAMLKYQIDDMRLLFENDIRFLRQF
ncbi:MAG: phenylalanine--tRNA ligase subunit alpha [Acidobacteriota bacterium]